ncbi:MAG: hypothetical protein JOZ72_17685 [Alphaproteobacteria bacterium]|nr:hypothetical protein [Alphaproteobacteria bacterium]
MSVVTGTQQPDPAFSAGDVVRVARARSGLILAVAVLTVLAAAAVLMWLPTLYSTSASVMLDPRKNNVADLSSVLSQLPTDPASLQNQIQILESRDLGQEVIAKLALYDDPEFNSALKARSPLDPRGWLGHGSEDASAARERIITAFEKNLSVTAEGLSTTLTVTYTSRDPEKAALIANTLVDTYIDDQIQAKRDIGDKTTNWLVGRTRELANQLQAQEAAVQKYKADNNITEAADGSSLADQQISAISNQLVLAKADLAAKQATNDRIGTLMRAGDTADVSQILASPLIVQLRTQQATLIAQESELSTRYGPRHPKMEAVETQKRDLDAKIATEVNRLAGSIGNDVAVARANVSSLQGSLGAAEKQASNQNLVRVKLRALQSNAASTRTMYEAFVQRLRETQDQDAIQNPDARVISHAAVPGAPSSPKRMMILGASLPIGLVLGLLIALVAERFGAARPVRVQPARVQPAMAFRPAVAARRPAVAMLNGIQDPRAADAPLDWPNSEFSRATAALLRQAMRAGKVVAVTGNDWGQAKTATAAALARTAARAGLKVAVVDASLAHPMTGRAFGLGPVRFGLVEALTGTAPVARAFCRDPRSSAQVLLAAHRLGDPTAVLASARMARLVAYLRRACDLVILDAPPLGAGSQFAAVSRLADTTVAVARSGQVELR